MLPTRTLVIIAGVVAAVVVIAVAIAVPVALTQRSSSSKKSTKALTAAPTADPSSTTEATTTAVISTAVTATTAVGSSGGTTSSKATVSTSTSTTSTSSSTSLSGISTSTSTSASPSGTGATPSPTTSAPTLRDPAYWPYDSRSPWNMPIGSSAVLQAPTSSSWTSACQYGFILTYSVQYSIPVAIASLSDPIRQINRTDGNPPGRVVFNVRVPDNITIGTGTGDDQLAIVDEDHHTVIEMIHVNRLQGGNIQAPFPNRIWLNGTGISTGTYIGCCAYGGSCFAGLIRKGEIISGIRHALRMSLSINALNWTAPDGKHFVWPAVSADNNGNYPGDGNIYIGSLLAIPASVNISALASVGSPLYVLGKALQDYGAYITDRGQLNIYVEPAAASEVSSLQYNKILTPYLQVVVNNGPNSIGGGGTPRQPLAPDLQW